MSLWFRYQPAEMYVGLPEQMTVAGVHELVRPDDAALDRLFPSVLVADEAVCRASR